MIGSEAVIGVLKALNESGVDYMVTGSLATNLYTAPRSTKDADIVIRVEGTEIQSIVERLPSEIRLDPQMKFETITMTTRYDLVVAGSPFRIELFILTEDAHHQERFRRRISGSVLGTTAYVPTPEDVVIQKVRWVARAKRLKDVDDAKNVIADQVHTLDWPYIERWCREHDTLDVLEQVRRDAAELMGE